MRNWLVVSLNMKIISREKYPLKKKNAAMKDLPTCTKKHSFIIVVLNPNMNITLFKVI